MAEAGLSAPQKTSGRLSAGILLYRETPAGRRVLLAHPGGPFFAKKDLGAWSIPKGLVQAGESLECAARREFAEELGWSPRGELRSMGESRLRSGKRVVAFALACIEDEQTVLRRFAPGSFSMSWPPNSGRMATFPEVDRAAFFKLAEARLKINPAQATFLDRLAETPADNASAQ